MQKNKYKLSKSAQDHLRKIKSYTINNFSEMQWRNYKDTLLTGFQMLADNPSIGHSCNEIYPSGFYFPVGKHTAYFTKEDGFGCGYTRSIAAPTKPLVIKISPVPAYQSKNATRCDSLLMLFSLII